MYTIFVFIYRIGRKGIGGYSEVRSFLVIYVYKVLVYDGVFGCFKGK